METRHNPYESWTVPTLDVWMECTNVDPGELLQQLEAGDKNAILEILDGQTIPLDDSRVILYKGNDITIEESTLIEESTEKYWFPLKIKVKKPLGDVTFLGSILLSEQNTFIPRLFLLMAVRDGDTDDWSIYDASGNVKEELVSKNIPTDALTWNGSSYYIFKGFETWEEAEAYCESLGGHLAVITSDEENKAVYSYVTGQGYEEAFFGASDVAWEGAWKWVDGSDMSYTNWHDGEPDQKTEEDDYIVYYYKYKDGTWDDSCFRSDSNIICEWD